MDPRVHTREPAQARAVSPTTGERAVSSIVGVAMFIALTVTLAGVLAATTLAVEPGAPGLTVALSLVADAGTDRIALTHEGGDRVQVEELRVQVWVDGVPLAHQPPVPFFVARGFRAGPTGPFNVGGEGTWTAGETAGVRIASTNDPAISPGVTVRVKIYAADRSVADLRAVAS